MANKRYVVLFITRQDLRSLAFSEKEIASLSDEDMQEIAIELGMEFVGQAYTDCLSSITSRKLEKTT